MKHSPWIISIAFIFILNVAMTVLNWNETQVIKAELKQPKAVQIRSNGVISQWPIDGRYVKIVKDKYK